MSAVIDDFAGAGYSTCFQEIDTQAVTAVNDVRSPNTILTQVHYASTRNVVFRQTGYKLGRNTIVSQ